MVSGSIIPLRSVDTRAPPVSVVRSGSRATAALACAGGFGFGRNCRRGSRLRASGRVAMSARVVVHVPSLTHKLEAGRRHRTLKHTVALGALGLRLGVKALNLFELVTTLSTAIRIKWQFNSLRGVVAHCEYSTGSSANTCKSPIYGVIAPIPARERSHTPARLPRLNSTLRRGKPRGRYY